MAGAIGEPGADLKPALPDGVEGIPFHQLVYLLLRAGAQSTVGGAGPASRETIRFRAANTLAFAPTDVAAVEEIEDRPDPWEPPRRLQRITVNFLGLYGPASPMPNHLTEEILQGGLEAQPVRDFLDLFHHRMISFLYRAWERVRHPVLFDPGQKDPMTRQTLCLLGLGTEGAAETLPVPSVPLLRMAGLLVGLRRSAAALECLLRDRLPGIAVRVESCVPRRTVLPEEAKSRLGRTGRLGADARLGEQMAGLQSAFRVVLGPLSARRYRALLPGREEFRRLVSLIRFFAPTGLVFSLRLQLPAAEAPPLRLDPRADLPLGRMSWLLSPRRGLEEVEFGARRHDPLSAAAPVS